MIAALIDNSALTFTIGVIVGLLLGLAVMWAYREADERDRAYDDDVGAHKIDDFDQHRRGR